MRTAWEIGDNLFGARKTVFYKVKLVFCDWLKLGQPSQWVLWVNILDLCCTTTARQESGFDSRNQSLPVWSNRRALSINVVSFIKNLLWSRSIKTLHHTFNQSLITQQIVDIGWPWFESRTSHSLACDDPHGFGRASRQEIQIQTTRAGSIPVCVLALAFFPKSGQITINF